MRIYLHPGTQLYAPGDAYSCIRRGRYMRFHPRLIVWREEGCTGIGREGIISLKKFNKSVFITDLFVILHQIRERSEQTAHRYMPALRKEPFREGDPDESEIGRYYESPDYISHTDTRRGLANRLYHYVRQYMLRRKARLIKRCCGLSRGRLLDIGTGTGYFPHFMQERGWRVSAIEKSPQARAFAHEHFGLEADAPEALDTYEAKSFDVVTLWHVMEHLQHLNETWERLYSILDDRGILVIAVPNPTSSDARHYKEMWAAYDVPRHLWHFTPAVMQQFGAKHGFILTERHPMPFDAFYVSMLSEKYRKSGVPFLKGMAEGAEAGLASLMKKERSSSMIYVFQKKVKA